MTLNPRDYQSFDEYLEAIRVSEAFEKKVEQVSDIFSQDYSEIEEREAMNKIGFDWHDDEDKICGREFCIRHDVCLAVILDEIEYSANTLLFGGMLLDIHKILDPELGSMCTCDELLPVWFEQGSEENTAIETYIKIIDFISEYGYSQDRSYNDIVQDNIMVREFLEDLYFWFHAVLRSSSLGNQEKFKKSMLKKIQSPIFGLEITSQIRNILYYNC